MGKKACFVSTTSITMKCFIVPIARELVNAGVEVTLICSNDESMYPLCEANGVKYHPIHMGRGIDASGLKAIKEIKTFLETEKFDLVQYCTPNAACYASIAAKLAKVPTRLYCQWGIRYVGLSGISRKVFKAIEKMVCRLSTDIRVVSWKNKDFAVSEGLYKSDMAKVVGNGGTIGVDMTLFDSKKKAEFNTEIRTKYSVPENAFVFGFCGRLSRDKGGNELLKAFKSISENNNNVILFIVGDIEINSGIDEELFIWAKSSKSVFFTGKIPEAEVYHYYAPMDVLVHPTYREGFGMVIQEAGAYGIPCITTNIPGASEVMVDGESCILVDVKDYKALEGAMKKVYSDKTLLERMSIAVLKRTRQLYDRPIMLEFQKSDYLKVLGKTIRIVISDKELNAVMFPSDVQVIRAGIKDLKKYAGNEKIVAIVGSRAMAIEALYLNFPGLKLFQLTSAGYDGVPIKEYNNRGIMVANAGSVYSAPIAETVILGMLLMAKRLHNNPNNRHFKLLRHYDTTISEIMGKKILIMGTGNIGTAIASRLQGFEAQVDGYNRSYIVKPQYSNIITGRKELLQNIGKYDYIISTLPDSEETKGFINKELIENMSDNVIIVNVGRKAVFNECDLFQALKHGHIKGAVLDMFEKIPNPLTNKFRRLSNVIVLPGVSAVSKEVNTRLTQHICNNLAALLNEQPIPCVIKI